MQQTYGIVQHQQAMWKPAWLEALNTQKFFVACSFHEHAKKNEKNICCLDCCTSICPHCVAAHRVHRLLQVRRYVYHDVVRLEDLEKLIDCSSVQVYQLCMHVSLLLFWGSRCKKAYNSVSTWCSLIPLTALRLFSWRRDHRIGNSRDQGISAPPATGAFKNRISTALWIARWLTRTNKLWLSYVTLILYVTELWWLRK